MLPPLPGVDNRSTFLFLKRLLEYKGILLYITLLFQRWRMKIILSMPGLQMVGGCLIPTSAGRAGRAGRTLVYNVRDVY